MTTSYPSSLDNFTNPTASDSLSTPSVLHSDQHANANDAIEAMQSWVGVSGSAVTGTLVNRVSTLETGKVEEAPKDGRMYGRVSGTWAAFTKTDEVYFHARISGSHQPVPSNTNTVVLANHELMDSHGFYDHSTGTFTPQISGTYEFTIMGSLLQMESGKSFWLGIQKNSAVPVYWGNVQAPGLSGTTVGAGMVQSVFLNGSTDYVQIIVWHDNSITKNLQAAIGANRWSGRRISADNIIGI